MPEEALTIGGWCAVEERLRRFESGILCKFMPALLYLLYGSDKRLFSICLLDEGNGLATVGKPLEVTDNLVDAQSGVLGEGPFLTFVTVKRPVLDDVFEGLYRVDLRAVVGEFEKDAVILEVDSLGNGGLFALVNSLWGRFGWLCDGGGLRLTRQLK